ncbi:phenylacetate--CoA ligase family protein [Citrifermentans bremense]|uniref:phenylacetate--CoA ligase family protein n=1 Tax=Citrifermentans bremense TaxID=60035 RepID=UPI00041F78CC|nr:phenylacetate--CoA ligase family protein [Citrifermentans bremense]
MPKNLRKRLSRLTSTLYGGSQRQILKSLNQSQWWPKEQIEKHQLERLRETLAHCYDSYDFYRERLDRAGVDPCNIKSLKELARLPVLTKEEYHSMYRNAPEAKGRVEHRKTSGTTGLALQFRKTIEATTIMRALDSRSLSWYGIAPGDRQARFWSASETSAGRWKQWGGDYLLNRYRFSVNQIDDGYAMRLLEDLRRCRPDYVYGYASGIYEFSKLILRHKVTAPRVKAVIVTSEMLYRHQKEVIHEAFGSPVVREYGSTEFGPIAFECEQGELHVMDENLIVESCSDDGEQKLLVTELNNRDVPFIRYEIGDAGVVGDRRCSCGRNLTVLSELMGRTNGFIRLMDGSIIYDNIFDFLITIAGVDQIQVVLVARDKLQIFFKGNDIDWPGVEKAVETLKGFCGGQIEMSWQQVDEIPLDKSGKRNYFKSLVGYGE